MILTGGGGRVCGRGRVWSIVKKMKRGGRPFLFSEFNFYMRKKFNSENRSEQRGGFIFKKENEKGGSSSPILGIKLLNGQKV